MIGYKVFDGETRGRPWIKVQDTYDGQVLLTLSTHDADDLARELLVLVEKERRT